MSTYNNQIMSLLNPSFKQIRRIACDFIRHLPQEERNRYFCSLQRGVAVLETNEQLFQYFWSYGDMHEAKIQTALKIIPTMVYNNDFALIDWGCGQGLASVCFFDFLNQNNIQNKTQKVILIEPSKPALERARLHVNAYLQNESKIQSVNKYLNDVTQSDIHTDQSVTLHFFSNILDIPQIDLKKIAKLFGGKLTGEHYFCCVGPLNPGNQRIDKFYEYFNSPLVLSDIEQSENMLKIISEEEQRKAKYTLKHKVFKFERNKIYYIPIDYYPAVQFHAAYQLDSVKKVFKNFESEKAIALYKILSDFEVSSPFDIGASIYDDVDPVFAVLNNMIIRGLPTKASPFIEEIFKCFGNRQMKDNLGAIVYDFPDSKHDDLFLALHTIDPRWELTQENYNCKILDSELEKEYITNVVPNLLRQLLQPQRSLLSITNNSNHCAQRVDFACEFPYSNNKFKGCVVELDGVAYHTNTVADKQRDRDLNNSRWNCLRITETQINYINDQQFSNNYILNTRKAYQREFTEDWTKALQLVLSPIAVARIQKTVLEAIIAGKLDIKQAEWNILVQERDVPCAAIAFEDLKQMFDHLHALVAASDKKATLKFPKVNIEIISTKEFANSSLHLNITPTTKASACQSEKKYDMIIDISMLRRAGIENISFSEFQCKNDCYFNIRSAHFRRSKRFIYTSDTIGYKPLVDKDGQGNYIARPHEKRHLEYFLQLLFRKEDFRPGQLPILSRALQNKCVIGLLPTGGGKSLTYQLSAMLQPGVTIVVDPLRSLMKDQYDGLINTGIDTCTFINSTLTPQQREEREKQLETSQMQFIFLSPERLCIYKFRERLKTMHDMNVYFAYGVIDEVHCVSEWGHDFRFSYLHLGRNLYNYVCPKDKEKRLTLFGLTATASFDVLADVERELSGNGAFPLDSDTIVRYENTNRLELQYKIEKVPIEYEEDIYFDKNKKLNPSLPKSVNISDKWVVYKSKNNFLNDYIQRMPTYINDLQTLDSTNIIKARFNARQNTQEATNEINLNTDFSNDFYIKREKYNQAGIVFCPHAKNTGIAVYRKEISSEKLPNTVSEQMSKLMTIGTFVGSSSDSEETETSKDESKAIDEQSFKNLELFRNDKLPLMVATKAFGMGIDKQNVRFTVNMNYSSSLESFVQEAGRAGRDRKIALATILFADYKLVRINLLCPLATFPMLIIKNKWFKEEDLLQILNYYRLNVDSQYFDYYTPQRDLVKLRCEVSNQIFAFGECETRCDQFNNCALKNVPKEAKGFQYFKDLEEILKNQGLEVPKKNLEYISADYDTVMYFYNNNFKGSLIEEQNMRAILNQSETKFFIDDDEEIKPNEIETVNNFLQKLLSVEVGTELVAFVSYIGNYADYAKAIYRMCCIGLIDDFTQDYSKQQFRIVTKRKADGEYCQGLKQFLMRYYSTERAEEEIQKVPECKGKNEIENCLAYLTEFIYEKIAVKRKRAIDDMRTFCIQGIDDTKDWKEVNEELKDFIYFYFNSKYAKDDYETENGEPFSLTTDTDRGRISSFEILIKYLRVIDDNVYGSSGSPKDSVKHLQGAVRLIRRSLTDSNATLAILNAFCLSYLGTNKNEVLEQEMESSFIEGYMILYNENKDKQLFYDEIEKMMRKLQKIPMDEENIIQRMNDWRLYCELELHNSWLNNFKKSYIK